VNEGRSTERRALATLFACISIYYFWIIAFGPVGPAPIPEDQLEQALLGDAPVEAAKLEPANEGLAAQVEPSEEPPPTPPAQAEAYDVSFCGMQGSVSSLGGGMSSVKLIHEKDAFQVTPIYSWLLGKVTGSIEGPYSPYGETPGPVTLVSAKGEALTLSSGTMSDKTPMTRVDSADTSLVLEGRTSEGLIVRQSYQEINDASCQIAYSVQWTNPTSAPLMVPRYISMMDSMGDDGAGMMSRYNNVRRLHAHVDNDIHSVQEEVEDIEWLDGSVNWMGMSDRYFGLLLNLHDQPGALALVSKGSEESSTTGPVYRRSTTIEPGSTDTLSVMLYAGELEMERLTSIDEAYGDIIDFGWFSFFAMALFWIMKACYSLTGSWGLAIILLTVLVKIVFFPLTQKAYRSGQAMQLIQPQIAVLREKHKNDNDTLNKEMMALFKDNKVNPLGGCLPSLVQLPVFVALYNVLLSVVELYHTKFLYIQDLSSVDPYCIMPAIVVVMMVVQQQFTPMGNMDPAQARMMKMLPLVFGFFFFIFPAGLVLYIFVNMALSIAQMWWIKRQFKEKGQAEAVA
jgi:YidC/Oxa1 family membrane protein insertase